MHKVKVTTLGRQFGTSRYSYQLQEFAAKLSKLNATSFRAAQASKINGGVGDPRALLKNLVRLEMQGRLAPTSCGEWMVEKLTNSEGRVLLAQAADELAVDAPKNILLLYLRCLGLIERNKFEDAHKLVSDLLCEHCENLQQAQATNTAQRKYVAALGRIWKVVDSAARDQMSWIVDNTDEPMADQPNAFVRYFDLPHVNAFEKLDKSSLKADYQTVLAYAEPLLQGKQNAAWLGQCELAYKCSTTLFQRMRAIRSMWRQGLRRIPDYRDAYDMAGRYFKALQPELQQMREDMVEDKVDPYIFARLFRTALSIARHLSLSDEASQLREDLVTIARSHHDTKVVWIVVNALSHDKDQHETTRELIGNKRPTAAQDLHDFFQWATRFGEMDLAKSVFDELPESLKRHKLALAYSNVLQRTGQFEEAEKLIKAVYARQLQNQATFDPERSQALIRRIGELRFAAETARYFLSVPQPINPIGVILATPRNIEQLRRSPLTVFLEWKKMGWAVIPLYEGVLPIQPTGIDKIDRYAGCIGQNGVLKATAQEWLEPAVGCKVDLGSGKLAWEDIDLSHALWEEASINRRCYEPEWKCPALQRSLGNLVGWTNLMATVLKNTQSDFGSLGLRTGIQTFFNFRLPDALQRFYCAEYGNAETFFCIHSSNSYENYFTNFSKNLSSLLSIRNMTSAQHIRAAAFPTPEMVVEKMKTLTPEKVEEVRAIVKIKRSTGGVDKPKSRAEQAREQILEWRKRGGKVACAFGKVICDSAVPFDGGPAHKNMEEWLNDTIHAATGSQTLLLIKPHPHELREEISCFLNSSFFDLIEGTLPDNVLFLGHDWFDIGDLEELIDLALIYNSTTSIEMALLGIPTVVASHFSPIDYAVGHTVISSRKQYHSAVRFEKPVNTPKDGIERATAWLSLMKSDAIAVPYKYHSRQITNCVVYPPWWIDQEIERYLQEGDENVSLLARRGIASLPPHKDNGHDKLPHKEW